MCAKGKTRTFPLSLENTDSLRCSELNDLTLEGASHHLEGAAMRAYFEAFKEGGYLSPFELL